MHSVVCVQMCVHRIPFCVSIKYPDSICCKNMPQRHSGLHFSFLLYEFKLINIINGPQVVILLLIYGFFFFFYKSMSLNGLVAAPRGCAASYIQVV